MACMLRVEGGGDELGASHVEMLIKSESKYFIVEMGVVSRAGAASRHA